MTIVNVATCELTVTQDQGRFRCRGEELGGHLGARLIGAAVYEMPAGGTNWPYHIHHGVEEWMFVVSGAPVLRDQSGERALSPGTLVAFASGPAGAHTVAGPGRVVIFSAGAEGWAAAWASEYPDSDKLAVGGWMFRRADAIATWIEQEPEPPYVQAPEEPCPTVDLTTIGVAPLQAEPGDDDAARGSGRRLGPLLGARTWEGTLWELAPGESTAPYHHESRREEWALVLSGAPTLRHPDGEDMLAPHDIVGFPDGPPGAHQLSNAGPAPARVLVVAAPVGLSSGTFNTEQGTAVVRLCGGERLRFRLSDRITGYWDGEPGA